MKLAPVVLFVYNRLEHTQKVVEALKRNMLAGQTELIIYSDWAKHGAETNKVLALRVYLTTITGFKHVSIINRERNYGLAENIVDGVSTVVEQYNRIIVLEDDLVTSPFFLQYMNEALEKYTENDEVACINGYVYPVTAQLPETFFLRGADCWGWATWKRAWKNFERDGQPLLDQLIAQNLTYEFDYNDGYAFTKMLKDQIMKKNNSWAIRWQASAFLNNKLTLYPGRSLVHNIGNDGSGVHSGVSTIFDVALTEDPIVLLDIPLAANQQARNAFVRYFHSIKPGILIRVKYKLKTILNHVFTRKTGTTV